MHKFALHQDCRDLFVYREDSCIYHLKTNMVVKLDTNVLKVGDVCEDGIKARLNKNGTITMLHDESKCVTCSDTECKLSGSYPSQGCTVFSFLTG